jgi:phosphate transport system permease protein
VLLTSGVTAVLTFNPFSGPMISLPLQVFDFVKSPEPTMIARGFGTAAVLLLLVLLLFSVARVIGGRPPGQLSPGQQRRTAAWSLRDALRFERRQSGAALASAPAASAPAASASAASAPTVPKAEAS